MTENLLQSEKQFLGIRLTKRNLIILGVVFALSIGAATAAFFFVREFVKGWTLTEIPGAPVLAQGEENALPEQGELPEENEELSPPVVELPDLQSSYPMNEKWDGASRVNVLIMGLDYRDWEENSGASRTDTMILLTIDPQTKTAGMLSIPRDLWVSIPGFDSGKINTAYYLGEVYKLPGGGPGLAIDTVEHFLGVPIHYYAEIEFITFIHLVDEIGGLKLRPEEPIILYPLDYPDFETSTKVTLEPGVYTVPGNYALAYARARYSDGGDFDRAKRTQEVIMGFREQLVDFNIVPKLLPKIDDIYQRLSEGIHTNMSLQETIQLGLLALELDLDNIEKGIIGPDVVYTSKSPDGLDILIPIPDEIRLIRDEIFTSNELASPLADQGLSSLELAISEGAQIAVLNATLTEGLAGETADYLTQQGLTIRETQNANILYDITTIHLYNGTPYTIQYLSELMNIPENRIFNRYDPTSDIDIAVSLGSDWALNNPMP